MRELLIELKQVLEGLNYVASRTANFPLLNLSDDYIKKIDEVLKDESVKEG